MSDIQLEGALRAIAKSIKDPRWGAVCWPIVAGAGIWHGDTFLVVAGSFFAGVAISLVFSS